MKFSPEGSRTAEQILEKARGFLESHPGRQGIDVTYGYFTRHPVAGLNRMRLTALLDLAAGDGRPERILDLACGGGLLSSAFALHFGEKTRVVGLDHDADEIRLAQAFEDHSASGARFEQADLIGDPGWESRAEELLGGKPDTVVLAYALHHLPEVETFCQRLGKWLTPGSRLLINEENPRSPTFLTKHLVRGLIQKDTDEEWHRTYPEWKRMLEDSGFHCGPPRGLDPVPGLGRFPQLSWSLVFKAVKR